MSGRELGNLPVMESFGMGVEQPGWTMTAVALGCRSRNAPDRRCRLEGAQKPPGANVT
jgi:hypothetical protein